MAVVGEAAIRIVPDTRGFEQDLKSDVEDPVARSAKRIGLALAAAFSIQQVGSFFKGTIDAASAAEEAASKVGVVFGEASGEVDAFADSATDAFGQSRTQALSAAGVFGNLFRAIGLAEGQSAEFATTLTGLASDLASFNDVEIDEALTALQSGLVGETEPLKRFGVNLNQAAIDARALELGLAATKDAITPAVKAQAAYSLILEQTSLAQGDFQRTSEGVANSQRSLSAEWENARAQIGQGLLPVWLELIATARDDLIPAIAELAEAGVPLLAQAFDVASPAIGAVGDIFGVLAPAAEAVLGILDKIPDPLLQIGAIGFAASKGLFAVNAAVTGLGGLQGVLAGAAGGFGGLAQSVRTLNPTVVGVTAAVGLGAIAYSEATRASREYNESVKALTEDLKDVASGQSTVNEKLRDFIDDVIEGLGPDVLADLRSIGVGFDEIEASITGGGDSLDPLRDKFDELGLTVDGVFSSPGLQKGFDVGKLDDARQPLIELVDQFNELDGVVPITVAGLEAFIERAEDIDGEFQDANKAILDYLVTSDNLTEAQVRQAEEAFTTGGVTNYAGAVASLEPELAAAVEAAFDAGDATSAFGDAAGGAAGPTDDLADSTLALTRAGRLASGQIIDSAEALDAYVDATIAAYEAELDLSAALDNQQDAVRDLAEAEDRVADLRGPEGAIRQRIAVLELADAQKKLAEAQGAGGRSALEIVQAESALTDARREAANVADEVANAEQRLQDARIAAREAQEALEDFQGAEGANRRRIVELQLQEARDDLAKLRAQGGAASIAEAKRIVDQAKAAVAAVSDEDEGSRRRRLADKRLIDAEANLARARKQGSASALELAQAQQKVFDAEDALRDFGQAAEQAVINRNRATEDLIDAQEQLGDAVVTQGARQQEANLKVADAQRKLTDAQRGTEASALDVAQAQLAVIEAQDNLTGVSEDLADAEDEVDEKQRAVAESGLAVAEAAAELAEATGDSTGALGDQIDSLEDLASTLAPGSPLRVRIEKLIADLKEIDGEYQATITANATQAKRELDNLIRYYQNNAVPVSFETRLDPALVDLLRARGIRISVGGGGGIPLASGFYGTLNSATSFVAGEAGSEDLLAVPRAIGGLDRVVTDLARRISTPVSGSGIVFQEGAIQVIGGDGASSESIAREVVDLIGYELTVRSDG